MAKRIVNDKTGLELSTPYFEVQLTVTRIDEVDDEGNVRGAIPIRNLKGDFSDAEVDEALDALGANMLSDDEKTTPPVDSEPSE